MKNQLIISVGREYGSGGHIIAKYLSENYNIPLYDNNLLTDIAEKKNLDSDELAKYDENPKKPFTARTVRGYSNAPEEHISRMQFAYLRYMAAMEQSFVIVGRCAEEILRSNPYMISIFVLGDREAKIQRTMERENLSRDEAVRVNESFDKKRKTYHNSFCQGKWGDSRNYELSVNSSKLGLEETTNVIIHYIDSRIKSWK